MKIVRRQSASSNSGNAHQITRLSYIHGEKGIKDRGDQNGATIVRLE